MDFTDHLTYEQLAAAVRSMPNGKALGIDALTVETLEVGTNRILSVMILLYRTASRSVTVL